MIKTHTLGRAVEMMYNLSTKYPPRAMEMLAERNPNPGRYIPDANELAQWDEADEIQRERSGVTV